MEQAQSSIVESLRLAHAALQRDLRLLENAIKESAATPLAILMARLKATSVHVQRHFRFEEQNGYMDAVRKRDPRLNRSIDQLAQEHGQLAQSLEALIKDAEAAKELTVPLRGRIHRWIEQVHQHEVRENDLVQDAFNQDIGAED